MTNANQKLSMEELDQVAGGSLQESSSDSKFLGALTGKCDRYGTGMIYWSRPAADEVRSAWSSVGIDIKMNKDAGNQYFLNGKEITQAQAMDHAQAVTGKQLDRSAWDW